MNNALSQQKEMAGMKDSKASNFYQNVEEYLNEKIPETVPEKVKEKAKPLAFLNINISSKTTHSENNNGNRKNSASNISGFFSPKPNIISSRVARTKQKPRE